MSSRTLHMNDAIDTYLRRVSVRDTDVQRRLREETAALDQAGMQICPEQGQLMRMLAGLVGARRAIEVGVFTGYSALCVALALPDDGELVACDVNEEWTAIARRYWSEAGVASKIRLHLAPALETLDALIGEGRGGEFDMAFIDADKTSYDLYYERCLELLRPGGAGAGRQRALEREGRRRERPLRGHRGLARLQREARRRCTHRPVHAAGGRRPHDRAKACVNA